MTRCASNWVSQIDCDSWKRKKRCELDARHWRVSADYFGSVTTDCIILYYTDKRLLDMKTLYSFVTLGMRFITIDEQCLEEWNSTD